MPSPIVTTTIQSCILNATSNLIAQFLTAYRSNAPYTINWSPVVRFIIFNIINCPPNFLWQSFLETSYPSHHLVPTGTAASNDDDHKNKELDREEQTRTTILAPRLSVRNTLAKFLLDQTVGATVNTLLFSVVFAGFRGAGHRQAVEIARAEFWPLMRAGWTLWPLVSFCSYALVKSVEGRALLGSLAGMGWGIYLSLMQS